MKIKNIEGINYNKKLGYVIQMATFAEEYRAKYPTETIEFTEFEDQLVINGELKEFDNAAEVLEFITWTAVNDKYDVLASWIDDKIEDAINDEYKDNSECYNNFDDCEETYKEDATDEVYSDYVYINWEDMENEGK